MSQNATRNMRPERIRTVKVARQIEMDDLREIEEYRRATVRRPALATRQTQPTMTV